jgi:phospholipid/cholesterol/gamma-HCH transport system permease protein
VEILTELAHGAATLRVSGVVDLAGARDLDATLSTVVRSRRISTITLDLGGVRQLGAAGVAAIGLAQRRASDRGVELRIDRLRDEHRKVLALFPEPGTPRPPPRAGWVERTGVAGYELFGGGRALLRMGAAFGRGVVEWVTGRGRLPRGAVSAQAVRIGANALPVVALSNLLLGVILTLEAGTQLRRFGVEAFLPDSLGYSVVREFGPLLTAIIVAGRSGSAMAAEMGTMTIREEVAALTAMGLSPERYLVLPRVLATLVALPALAVVGCAVAMSGGAMLTGTIGLAPQGYWMRLVDIIAYTDLAVGLTKSVVFAAIISITGCFAGLRTRGGGSSVGHSTTRAMVTGIVLIIVSDSAITAASTLWLDA